MWPWSARNARILNEREREEREEVITGWVEEHAKNAKEYAGIGKQGLIDEGVPEENVTFKVQAEERGVARDILAEFEDGNYGILVIGRKGSKAIDHFHLGACVHYLSSWLTPVSKKSLFNKSGLQLNWK